MYKIRSETSIIKLTDYPSSVYLLKVDAAKYVANNVTLPDLTMFDGLAAFRTLEDVEAYLHLGERLCLDGQPELVSFDQAREIAKEKTLTGLIFFVGGKIKDYHFVN